MFTKFKNTIFVNNLFLLPSFITISYDNFQYKFLYGEKEDHLTISLEWMFNFCSIFFQFFHWFLEKERKEEREREGEQERERQRGRKGNIDLLFHLFIHSWVASGISIRILTRVEPATLVYQDNVLTIWATLPEPQLLIFKLLFSSFLAPY